MFATIRIIVIFLVIMLLAAGARYVTGLSGQLAVSEINNQKMNEAVVLQQDLINQIKNDVASIQQANEELNTTIKAQNKDLNSLQNRFNTNADGSARDIGKIAISNPAGIQRAINRGTINAIRCLEIASGAPLAPEERNAKTQNEINKECPSLANPNYAQK